MARQAQRGQEQVTVVATHAGPALHDFGHAEPGDDGLVQPAMPATYADPSSVPVVADATRRNPKLTEEQLATVAPAKWYRVKNPERISVQIKSGHNVYRATLKPGKEISSLHYDIRDLQKQGVKLEKIDPSMPNDEAFVD